MKPKTQSTLDKEFRDLIEQTLASGPYANIDSHSHALWCTGFLKEMLIQGGNRYEVRKHLMNVIDLNMERKLTALGSKK